MPVPAALAGRSDVQIADDPDLEIRPGEHVCPRTDCRLIHLTAAGDSACDRL